MSSRCDYRAWWKCSKCGNEWDTLVYHRTRDRSGCPKCSHSKGENEIARYLDSKNVEYKTQHWFSDCRNIRPLPFDFYLSKYNACIEFQGMQHYAPIDFKNRTVSDDECIIERYEELKKRDQIKRDYCTKNKIALLEISYKDINRIPEILSVFLGS